MSNAILLDTHCWIWYQAGLEKQFSRQTRQHIERAAQRGACFVSVISVWEVGMLQAHNRLKLKSSLQDWIKDALNAPGIALAPLSVDIALESSLLPGSLHGDPADRMIVATARHLRLKLVTADKRILDYGQSGYVNVIESK